MLEIKTSMEANEEFKIALSTSKSLMLNNSFTSVYSKEYRRMIGGIQYMPLTSIDISFTANRLSQFMHKRALNIGQR